MITPDDLEKLLYPSTLEKEEIKKISGLLTDKVNEEKRAVDQLCAEITSFIVQSKNIFFKRNNLFLFSDYLSLKFPSSFRDIYIRNINIFYYLLDVGLEDCVKIEKTDEDIRICFFSDETIMRLAEIYKNSIVQKLDYDPNSMEMKVSLIIMDRNLITWQNDDMLNVNREMEFLGKIMEREKILFISITNPENVFEDINIPLIMNDDTIPISFILRDSLEAAVHK